jgi:[acyl-carrier-protein] S-malonyltransferase
MEKLVFMFDGQGAFKPGVGRALCENYTQAKNIVTKSSDVLGYDLAMYLWGDRANDTSGTTSIAQPAISTISLAYADILKTMAITADVSLGHSLGEVTAIVYCGIVSFEDGIRIIQKRGELMEAGGKEGTMMAIIKIDIEKLSKECEKVSQEISEPVVVANINAPEQIVISGSPKGTKRIARFAVENGGRGIPLHVGGAWHSPYLKNASKEFTHFLDTITFNDPATKFYSVVDQKFLKDGNAVKQSLKQQMLSQVHWVMAIENLKDMGYRTFLEIGPSKILKDLVTKVNSDLKTESTGLYADLSELTKLSGKS